MKIPLHFHLAYSSIVYLKLQQMHKIKEIKKFCQKKNLTRIKKTSCQMKNNTIMN